MSADQPSGGKSLSELLKTTQARFALGLVENYHWPGIGTALAEVAGESEAIFKLAGFLESDTDRVELFATILSEAGIPAVSKELALRRLVVETCDMIIRQELNPEAGARLIWKTVEKADMDTAHEYDPFIYAASEMEDRPRDYRLFERAIVDEAKLRVKRYREALDEQRALNESVLARATAPAAGLTPNAQRSSDPEAK
jgi:hypothetical protein